MSPAAAAQSGKVYRIHVSSGINNLAMLIGVVSRDPQETLAAYLRHAAVSSVSEPVAIPTMTLESKGIDLIIGEKKGAPGYAIQNRLKMHWLDRSVDGEY